MSAATANKTSYGYRVTGDTGTVTVSLENQYVKKLIFVGKSDGNQCVITDRNGAELFRMWCGSNYKPVTYDLSDRGSRLNGLIVSALSNGDDVLYILTR